MVLEWAGSWQVFIIGDGGRGIVKGRAAEEGEERGPTRWARRPTLVAVTFLLARAYGTPVK